MRRDPMGDVAWGFHGLVVLHFGALRSGVRQVEAVHMAIEINIGAQGRVVFVGCWDSDSGPEMDLVRLSVLSAPYAVWRRLW